jgi:tripartite-type tricarboxylate transporter receptor subunit TctC
LNVKRTIALTGCCMLGLSAAAPVVGQGYPTRPVRMIVPFPPGGGNDILARTVGNRLTEVVGQQVVVDNRGGAGGLIGAQLAATAIPDGYTIFLGSVGNLAQIPALKSDLPYHPLKDFAAVSLLATSAFVLAVHPAVPAKSVKELIALAKASPGKLNYASAGPGSSLHMAAELFKHATATDIVHVPYKGANPALTDLMSGRVQLIFSTMPPVLPHVKSGKLRGLGVTTAKRASAAPELPTIAESGVANFEVANWQGIVVPVKTPKPVVQKLNRDLIATLQLPGMTESLAAQGLEPAGGTPDTFAALIKREIAKYTQVVKAAAIRVD